MKKYCWLLAGPVAMAGMVLPCAAQTYPPTPASPPIMQTNDMQPTSIFGRPQQRYCPPSLSPPIMPTPIDPKTPVDPKNPQPQPQPQPQPTPDTDRLSGEGGYKSAYGAGASVSAGFGIGASVASAAAGLPVPQNNATSATLFNSTPVIMPGLFSAATTQSVTPIDRIGFDYGYFSRFSIASPAGAVPGFNLNQFNVSVEKTFFNGMASIYVNVPFLSATQNISGQDINGIGDVSFGFKALLYECRETGTSFAAGLTIAAPSAHPTINTSTLNLTFTGGTQAGVTPPPTGTVLTFTDTTTVNPTYFQPWAGGLWVRDRFFVQEYFGVLVPTDSRVATMINNNVTFGYELYRDPCRLISSVTPVMSVQCLLPMTHLNNSVGSTSVVGTNISCLTTTFPDTLPAHDFGFPDQVFFSFGAQIGLGERCLLSASVVTPVVGPRGYQVGGTFGLTYFY